MNSEFRCRPSAEMDFAEVMQPVAYRLLGEPNPRFSKQGELRFGNHGSMSVDIEKGVFFDHELSVGGGVIDLIKHKTGRDRTDAISWLRDEGLLPHQDRPSRAPKLQHSRNPQPAQSSLAPAQPARQPDSAASLGTIEATYDYVDEAGEFLFQVVRYQPKTFRQRQIKNNSWVWNLDGVRRVLYQLPDLLKAVSGGRTIYICEGEKDADNLRALGLAATTCSGGAGKWRSEYNEALRGADVVVIADNDKPGRDHAEQVAASLNGVAKRVRVLDIAKAWPECPQKGDISNWLEDGGGTADKLPALVEALPDWKPSAGVKVDAAELLTRVYNFLGKFVVYPSSHAQVAHTLWVAHTHLMDAWESTPRFAFLSAEPGSGKTRALEISELLVPLPVEAVNVSPAYLFRKVGSPDGRPTILYDEIDTVFGPKAKDNEEIRGLLNAGHRRGAVAGRCVAKGKIIETEEIPAYCAVALAGIGWLPDTLLSRCIIVRMRKRKSDERVMPFRRRIHQNQGHALRDELAVWAGNNLTGLTGAWPELPDGIEDRNADVWEPLLAIADAAGGEWPRIARGAAVALVAAASDAEPSLGIRLLSDLRIVFGAAESEKCNPCVRYEVSPMSQAAQYCPARSGPH